MADYTQEQVDRIVCEQTARHKELLDKMEEVAQLATDALFAAGGPFLASGNRRVFELAQIGAQVEQQMQQQKPGGIVTPPQGIIVPPGVGHG